MHKYISSTNQTFQNDHQKWWNQSRSSLIHCLWTLSQGTVIVANRVFTVLFLSDTTTRNERILYDRAGQLVVSYQLCMEVEVETDNVQVLVLLVCPYQGPRAEIGEGWIIESVGATVPTTCGHFFNWHHLHVQTDIDGTQNFKVL